MPSGRAIRAGRAFVELFADNTKLVRGLRAAQTKVRAFGQKLQNIGMRIATTTAAMALPIAIATRTFAGFEDQMAQVRAVTGATGRDFDKLTQRAKELGRTTSFTAAQVAGAMTELGRAGFQPAEILDSISSVLNLARATSTDLPRAAEIASAAMRGFGLTARDTTYIADVLTATANNSAQGLEDIGEALKYVAPMAKEAGEDIRDTAAALGVLANNGIKGSMAGTALARAYKNLSKTGSHKMLKKLGVDAVDANGNLRKVADILSDLGQATAKMGSAQRLSIFEQLFGRGSASAMKLANGANFKNMQNILAGVGGTAARIGDALAAGDLALAARVAWLGIQVAWTQGIGALESAWLTFTSGIQAVFWMAAKGIAEAALWVARKIENTWSEVKHGVSAIGAFLEAEAVNAVIRVTTDDDKQDAVIEENEKRYRKKVMGIKRNMDADIAKSNKFYDDKKKQVDDNYRAEMAKVGGNVIAKTKEIEAAQAKAQAELDAAVAEAKRKRREYEADTDRGPDGLAGPEGLEGKVAKLLGDLKTSGGSYRGVDELQSTTGTFGAMMLGGLGAGHTNIQERTAKAVEATAKNTKAMKRKMDNGPRFMR